jgi:tetratricopeptide (TPR) repeat protein
LLGFSLAVGGACREEGGTPSPARPTETPPAAKQALARARALFGEEKPFEAITEVEQAVALAPEWAEAHLSLGKLLLTYSNVRFSTATIDRARLEQAIEHLERACALDPTSAEAAYWAGLALAKGERIAEATRRFEETLALQADHGLALKELGVLFAGEGDSKRALEHLARARALLPKEDGLLLVLGLQLEAEERLEEARDVYLEACALNPAHPGPRSALAVLYGRLGDPAAAERMQKEFERCRAFGKRLTAASQHYDKNNRDPAACLGLAELYREVGMPDEAALWAGRALRIDPEHAPAKELLRALGRNVGEAPASFETLQSDTSASVEAR